ncbi:MAG: sugar phosphate isomerase/epimerase family protein [Candidatus Zipacnadales bacterium]
MGRSVHVDIGINGAFLTRRWEEPENWMRLTREVGFRNHSFCGDVIDPFFSGDKVFQMAQAAQVKAAAGKYGVRITDLYTGVATHRFHGLSHSHPSPRARMRQWIMEAMDLALAMGTDCLGGHWDAFSVEVLEDETRTQEAWDRLVATFRELGQIAADKGLHALYQEQMYIPSEVPWTLDQAKRFLIEVNQDKGRAVPVYLTLDVGHQAGMHYGLTGPDLDYGEWVRQFGAFSEVIHLQQTTPDGSHHWAFTETYNRQGHIEVPRVLEALEESHQNAADSPVAQVLPPAERCWLIAEIIPGSTKNETQLLEELRLSAEFLKQYVPEGGMQLTI